MIARELGGNSLFGELCITDLDELQTRLITITQLFDVINTATRDEVELPEKLKVYPGKAHDWYNKWKKKDKKASKNQSSSGGAKRVTFFSEDD